MTLEFAPRRLLFPLVPIYRLAMGVRQLWFESGLAPVERLTYPVISVGNLATGGSGKTPLTIALVKALAARGLRPDVLSRGYGRQTGQPAHVRADGTAEDFGDEPLLIARETGVDVYVAPRRFDAGVLAEADAEMARPAVAPESAGKDAIPASDASPSEENSVPPPAPSFHPIHLLDDGFQHRQLFRNADILLVNLHDWRDMLLPAGNLREPQEAIHRATVIAIPAEEPELEAKLRNAGWEGPVWRLRRKMEIPAVEGPVFAFCGIARPELFFEGLEDRGLHLVAQLAFPDHYCYSEAILEHKLAEARRAGAKAFITTEKDLARLGRLASVFPESMPLLTAKLSVEIENVKSALDWLLEGLLPDPG